MFTSFVLRSGLTIEARFFETIASIETFCENATGTINAQIHVNRMVFFIKTFIRDFICDKTALLYDRKFSANSGRT